MSRTLLIAGNWKMHNAPDGALDDASPYRSTDTVDAAVFPTFLDLTNCVQAGLVTGGQYGHPDSHGAHTGDVSMTMLQEQGCTMVLCGHSERRQYHGETDDNVADQAVAALACGLHPVICIGELEAERDNGQQNSVIERQLQSLPLDADITIAYEPVWAIGTGKTATPQQAQEMHAFIRSILPEDRRDTTRILYGGSMKPENAADLLSQPDIDGGLIGGASLKPDAFGEIVSIAQSI